MSADIAGTALNLTHSLLYDEKIVMTAYQAYLSRLPDPAGSAAWAAELHGGLRDEQLEAGFIGSQEYINNHGGNTENWIRGMYQDLLGRKPADAEVQSWLKAIAGGETFTQVAYGFANSAEREGERITADYKQYLGRAPEPGIVPVWVQNFESGATNENVIAGFLASAEYYQVHGNNDAAWYQSAYEDAYSWERPGDPVLAQDAWFRQNIQDPALRLTVEVASLDGNLDWNDTIAILRQVEQGGPISATEIHDLQQLFPSSTLAAAISINGQPVPMSPAVLDLASKVIGDNSANAAFQGAPLGDLHAGSSPTQLEDLVDKWFLGMDHPAVPAQGATYTAVNGNLFSSAGPVYSDIFQGGLGDCYLLASFATVAAHSPGDISSAFTYAGTGEAGSSVWIVRLYLNGQPDYLTVDNLLPTEQGMQQIYSYNPQNILWPALLEKAFAQEYVGNDYGNLDGSKQLNSYLALSGLTNLNCDWFNMDGDTLAAKLQQGAMPYVGSLDSPPSPDVVGYHGYAVVGYNPNSAQPFTLYNPWGSNVGAAPALLTVDAAFMNQNFKYCWYTVGAN
jgi:hypothetical protein